MHGNNVGTLFNHIHKESLPAELGGNAPPYNTKYWAEQLIGDGSFSFGQSQIFWPGSACCSIATSGRNRSVVILEYIRCLFLKNEINYLVYK